MFDAAVGRPSCSHVPDYHTLKDRQVLVKDLWAQSNRKLEQSMRLNLLLLEQWNLRKTDTLLGRLKLGLIFELALSIIADAVPKNQTPIPKSLMKSARFLVEMGGLEPPTPYMRSKCSTS